MNNTTQWIYILVGALLLLFGRRLFWLFVGCIGFIAGFNLGSSVFHGQSQMVLLLIAVGVGVIGAILTMILLDPALILLSSLAGATAISQNVPLTHSNQEILFIVLVVFGIIVQALQYHPAKKAAEPKKTG